MISPFSSPRYALGGYGSADRLRGFLSNTSTLSLSFRDESVGHIPPDYIRGLERYEDLVIGLSAFEAPTLWPSLVDALLMQVQQVTPQDKFTTHQ